MVLLLWVHTVTRMDQNVPMTWPISQTLEMNEHSWKNSSPSVQLSLFLAVVSCLKCLHNYSILERVYYQFNSMNTDVSCLLLQEHVIGVCKRSNNWLKLKEIFHISDNWKYELKITSPTNLEEKWKKKVVHMLWQIELVQSSNSIEELGHEKNQFTVVRRVWLWGKPAHRIFFKWWKTYLHLWMFYFDPQLHISSIQGVQLHHIKKHWHAVIATMLEQHRTYHR